MATTINEERFNALYAYRPFIQGHIRRLLKQQNADMVEDVLQDTWLSAWRALPRTPEAGSAWLVKIATNKAIDALRRKYHRRVLNEQGETWYGEEFSLDQYRGMEDEKNHASPEEWCEEYRARDDTESQALDRYTIATILAMMPDARRGMAILYLEGYSYQEIMARLSVSFADVEHAVRMLKVRGRWFEKESAA